MWDNGNLSLITEVEMSSSVTSLTWSEGSDYIYGIKGTTDVSTNIYIYIVLYNIRLLIGDWFKDRGMY